MPIANAYKEAVQNIINKLNAETTAAKPRRHLSILFLELPDPAKYADYYTIITEPRSINGVQEKLQKNRYRNILDVLNDLHLVFANALHYNEASSQIAKDAAVLKELFEKLWKDDPYLPNAQPTKQPGRKPGFRAIPLPRMSSFAQPMRHNPSYAPSYSTALATVQLKPLGKPPAPIVAPRLQPLKKRKRKPKATAMAIIAPEAPQEQPTRIRRLDSPAFSEVDFNFGIEGEEDDPEVPQTHIANEVESDAIVQRLDKSLPLWDPWEGTSAAEMGWMPALHGDALQARLENIVARMKNQAGANEQRPLTALEEVPTRPDVYSSCKESLAWISITTKLSSRQYLSAKQFEADLFRLFEKARRQYNPGSQPYGSVLMCQRLAQLLTLTQNPPPSDKPLTMSSVPGPRRAQPLRRMVDGAMVDNPQGVTCYDVLPKGREPAQRVVYKGVEYKTGDFVHLFNPEDMSRPLVGQIWACWTNNGKESFTVCWYLRPEQTIHSADHPFYENEVVKSGLYLDYLPEDIVEKVTVQFYPHYFTGRPRPPHWYPSWPIYACEQRYDERDRSFHHITNPENCFPPSLRPSANDVALSKPASNVIMRASLFRNPKLDLIHPIYPFERLVFPLRKTGPNAGPRLPPSSTGPTSFTIGPSDNKEVIGNTSIGGGFDARGRPKRMAAVKAASAVGTVAPSSPGSGGIALPSSGTVGSSATPGDRTVVSAAGGGIITSASVDKLPLETTHLFDRDPITNEMLWFSGAPLDVARPPKLHYSLDYLYQLTLKRKIGDLTLDEDGEAPPPKRNKPIVLPSASEVWYEVSVQGTNPTSAV